METTEKQLTIEAMFNVEHSENYNSILGGDDTNPTWEEYIENIMDEYKPHFKLIKEAIENPANEMYKITGEEKQNRDISFKFSDGTHFGFSWRAWGDIMQAIVGKREGYMMYYM